MSWVMTIAHRRAVDRVSGSRLPPPSGSRRWHRTRSAGPTTWRTPFEANLESQRVRRCLDGLSEAQRESVNLAYYGGYTYPQVAKLLGVALGDPAG